MNRKLLPLIFLFLSACILHSQTVNMKVSTYFYSWQRIDSLNGVSKTSHVRGYQNLLLDVNKNKWSINTSLQTGEDIINKIDDGFNYRFYNLYIKGTDLFNVLDLKLGRQYLFSGVGKGAMDGLYLKFKAGHDKEYQLSVFGGEITPGDYNFKKYNSLNNNFIVGSLLSYYGVTNGLTASLSYYNKRRKFEPYSALRLDSLFNTNEELIVTDSRAEHLAGLDLNYTGKQKYFMFGKAYYDINLKKFYRAEFNASYSVHNFRLSAGYTYREPQLTYNTTFWKLAQFWPLSNYKEVEGSVDYTFKNGINIFGKISEVIYIDANSLRFQIGFNHPSYGLSYILYSGYAGKSNGFNAYIYRELVKSKLSGNLTLNYSNYDIGKYSTSKENAFSGMLGMTYRPSPQFSVDGQFQLITNRIYKYDTRFLIGFNYWMFQKL